MGVTILASVFVFGLLVLFHEFGHFIMAKATGMRVDEFAIGFGPKLASKQVGETEYSIRCVPLGGFNDIAGMDPSNNDAGERGYCEKPVWKRMMTLSLKSLVLKRLVKYHRVHLTIHTKALLVMKINMSRF